MKQRSSIFYTVGANIIHPWVRLREHCVPALTTSASSQLRRKKKIKKNRAAHCGKKMWKKSQICFRGLTRRRFLATSSSRHGMHTVGSPTLQLVFWWKLLSRDSPEVVCLLLLSSLIFTDKKSSRYTLKYVYVH